MKLDHTTSYFYKYDDEVFDVQFNFTNDLDSDTLSSCTASIYDVDGTDKTASMLSSTTTSTPSVTFTITGGTIGETYEIKLVGTSSNSKKYVRKVVCEIYDTVTLNTKLGDPSANSYVTLSEANNYIRNVRGHSNTWDTLNVEGKKRVLIQACKEIDMMNFIDEEYYENQSLQFPRDTHDVITGNCATPFSTSGFSNTSFTSNSYGDTKSYTDYWKYGTVHLTAGTGLGDIRNITTSNITTDVITVSPVFSATPTSTTSFVAFEPLHQEIKDAQCEQALFIIDNTGIGNLTGYKTISNAVKIGDVAVTFKNSTRDRVPLSQKAKKLLSRWVRRDFIVQRG